LTLAALLVGCGGGGGDDAASGAGPVVPGAPTGPVVGLYLGTTTAGGTFDALILGSGRMYGLLGVNGGITTVFFGDGVVTDTGFASTAGGNLTTNSGKPLGAATVSLTGVPKTSITGTLAGSGPGFPATFTSTYRASFEGTPALATVAGTYEGDSSGLGRIAGLTLTVASNGDITGVSADLCEHTGKAVPDASANVYDITMTFGAGCPKQGTFTGHAILSAASGANPATLTMLAATSNFGEGWIFVGGKQ
jgi:hypothetical protein